MQNASIPEERGCGVNSRSLFLSSAPHSATTGSADILGGIAHRMSRLHCTLGGLLSAVQGSMKAREEDLTFGRMPSVLKRGPIPTPLPTTEQPSGDPIEDYAGRELPKRDVAPHCLTVVGLPLTVSLKPEVASARVLGLPCRD